MIATNRGSTSVFSIGMLSVGVILIVYSSMDFGPTLDSSSPVGWWAWGIGILLAFSSGVVYIIDISMRATTRLETIIPVTLSVLFFLGYLTWIKPISAEPVIFHPAAAVACLAAWWLVVSIYCGFRVSKS